jgi:signal transduction histidine kinase
MEQVVSNLLSNAFKYSPNGTVVEFQSAAVGDSIVISVRDHGIGILSTGIERIYEPFFRADNTATLQGSATGLGLFITKSIIDMHGGTIEIDSTPDVGTMMTLTLPRHNPDSSG